MRDNGSVEMEEDLAASDRRPAVACVQKAPAAPVVQSVETSIGPQAWYVLLLLVTVSVFSFADRMALAMLAPSIKSDLGLSDTQLGLLTGFAFSLFYAACGIPVARWADRGTRRNIIALALAIWSTMTALSGAAQGFWSMFVARVGIGAGEAGFLPAAQSIICDYVPVVRRPAAFAIHTLGNSVGMVVGLLLVGLLDELVGWRSTFLVLGIPGLALALVVKWTLREPRRGDFDVRGATATLPFAATVTVLFRCRTFRWLTLFFALNGFVQYGLNQWWPSFYARQFSLSLSSIGISLGLAVGGGAGIGAIVGGVLSNRAAKRDVRLPLFIGGAATLLAFPVALGSLLFSSAAMSITLVLLTSILWSVSAGPVIATVTSVAGSPMRATASAITTSFSSVVGFGLGPFCVGLVSDLLTPLYGTQALRSALLVPICLLPLAAALLYLAAKALPDDLRRMESFEIR